MLITHPQIINQVSNSTDGNMSCKYGIKARVTQNRKNFLANNGIDLGQTVVMNVEHRSNVVKVGTENYKDILNGDALITNNSNLCLFLLTADCLPITLFDLEKKVIALIHAGWKSLDLGIIQNTLTALTNEYKVDPKNLLVDIGPHIKATSYVKTNPKQKNDPQWLPYIQETDQDLFQIDLTRFTQDTFLNLGCSAENMTISPIDTYVSSDYFSHARSHDKSESEGRFATVVMMR